LSGTYLNFPLSRIALDTRRRRILHQIEICITKHKPFSAGRLKIDFNPRMRSLTLAIENDAIAKFTVPDPLAEANAQFGTGRHAAGSATRTPSTWRHGPADLNTWPDFLHQLSRNFRNKSRWL
jgi:hypothetical protein